MIDILLSTYNGEKYICQQIDSILRQTRKDWNLVIRDDGSIDKTTLIVDGYCRMHPGQIQRIDKDGGNKGVVRSFEFLLKESKCDYVMFCDQDDVWLPNKIEHTYNKMREIECENENKAIAVFSDLVVVDENANEINPSFWKYSGINLELLCDFNRLAVGSLVTGCTLMLNKKARGIVFPFPEMAEMHDYWISIKVAGEGILSPLKEPLILYRQHAQNCIGAQNMEHSYLKNKLIDIKKVWKANKLRFRLLHELYGWSLSKYMSNKAIYMMKSHSRWQK